MNDYDFKADRKEEPERRLPASRWRGTAHVPVLRLRQVRSNENR
jgi:hypothetical protein